MWKTLRIGALDINGNSHDAMMMMMTIRDSKVWIKGLAFVQVHASSEAQSYLEWGVNSPLKLPKSRLQMMWTVVVKQKSLRSSLKWTGSSV